MSYFISVLFYFSSDYILSFCFAIVNRRRLDEEDEKKKRTFCRTWCDMWFLLAHSSKPTECALVVAYPDNSEKYVVG